MLYTDFRFYWSIVEFFSGLIASVLSVIGIYSLFKNRKTNTPLVFWGVQAKNSKKPFTLLVIASVMLVVVFIVYIMSILLSDVNLKLAAYVLGTITYATAAVVVFLWVRYFARFI